MGLSVHFTGAADGDDGPFDLSTARGWQLVAEWVATLPKADAPKLRSLAALGRVRDTAALSAELAAALESHPPTSVAVRATLDALAEVLGVGDRKETATVTDGGTA